MQHTGHEEVPYRGEIVPAQVSGEVNPSGRGRHHRQTVAQHHRKSAGSAMADGTSGSRARHAGAQDVKGPQCPVTAWQRRPEQQRRGRMAERLAWPKQWFVGATDVDDRVKVEAARTHPDERVLHGVRPESRSRRTERLVLTRAQCGTGRYGAVGWRRGHRDIVARTPRQYLYLSTGSLVDHDRRGRMGDVGGFHRNRFANFAHSRPVAGIGAVCGVRSRRGARRGAAASGSRRRTPGRVTRLTGGSRRSRPTHTPPSQRSPLWHSSKL